MPKDLFSGQSKDYAQYRPDYPQALFDYLYTFVNTRDCAWDCATGNGQAAVSLAAHFAKVEATDISAAQLQHAVQRPNISYGLCPAEATPFAGDSFDLITVAQAYHWLDWDAFHKEATRVGKPGAVVAAWSYGVHQSGDERLDGVIRHFYNDVTGPYWDKERRYIDEGYRTVDFPFAPLPAKDFEIVVRWRFDTMVGYFQSWSAVQHYIRANGASPLPLIGPALREAWGSAEERTFRFPVYLKIGRIV